MRSNLSLALLAAVGGIIQVNAFAVVNRRGEEYGFPASKKLRQQHYHHSFPDVSFGTRHQCRPSTRSVASSPDNDFFHSRDDDDMYERRREYSQVRKRGRKDRRWEQEVAEEETDSNNNQQVFTRSTDATGVRDRAYDPGLDFEDDEFDSILEDLEDEDDDMSNIFSDIVIPNPLLDSMDPDGSLERIPEMLADPRFWFEILFFLALLDFVSFALQTADMPMGF